MEMEVRTCADPVRFARMNTSELRENFLIDSLFEPGKLKLVYSDIDRMIVASAVPVGEKISLQAPKELLSDYFAERREIGVVNIGGPGTATVDGVEYSMEIKAVLYIGKGSKEVDFVSADKAKPALFYITSFTAHTAYPTTLLKQEDAVVLDYGSKAEANKRSIHCYFTEKGIQSCQLCIGITDLAEGSIWNTMPAHLHPTRSEVYLYFNMDPDTVLFHFLGEPDETRHIAVRNNQAVLSPSWSIHSGAGTKNYSFIWSMGGENKKTLDIDGVKTSDIK